MPHVPVGGGWICGGDSWVLVRERKRQRFRVLEGET
jgi:hypothetical protein